MLINFIYRPLAEIPSQWFQVMTIIIINIVIVIIITGSGGRGGGAIVATTVIDRFRFDDRFIFIVMSTC